MKFDPVTLGYIALCLLAILDIFRSQLTPGARVMWAITVIFLPVVGLLFWGITRATAFGPEPEPPPLPPSDTEQPAAV